MGRVRIDQLLVERGLFETRRRAQAAIRAGSVFSAGARIDKPGRLVEASAPVEINEPPPYVGRGGEKLKGALEDLGLEAKGLVALDVGASTGGFTDCLLQEGAARVYCVDVGKGQLAWKLRRDERVVAREGVNARYLRREDFPEGFDLITADLSFISLEKVLPALLPLLREGKGLLLVLVKPQFELSPREVGKGGVVRDEQARRRAVDRIRECARRLGASETRVTPSRLPGPAGNREFFVLIEFGPERFNDGPLELKNCK